MFLSASMDSIKKVLKARGEALGGTAEISAFDPKLRTLTIEVNCSCSIDTARTVIENVDLGFHPVLSKPSPASVELYESLAEATKIAGEEFLVLPYRMEGEPNDKFAIIERYAFVGSIDIADAKAVENEDGGYRIPFTLHKDGAQRMATWTESNIGNYLAVVMNGRAIQIAYVRSIISDQGEISGSLEMAEAKRIAGSLASGRLPRMNLISESVILPATPSP